MRTRDAFAPLTRLREAVERAPDSAQALFALGLALVDRGEHAEALTCFERAAAAQPAEALYHRAAGLVLGRGPGREAEAVACFERAIALAPDEPGAYEALGDQHVAMGECRTAARALAVRAIARFPDRPKSYVTLCRLAFLSAGDEALSLIDACLPPNGRRDLFGWASIRALMDVGRYHEARARLVREAPDCDRTSGLLLLLGRIEDALGDTAAARRRYAEALRLEPTDQSAIARYLTVLWQTGDYEALRSAWRTPAALDARAAPAAFQDPESLRNLVILLRNPGGFGDALQWSRAACVLHDLGARVVVEARSAVRPLIATIPGVDDAIAPYDACPSFDLACPADAAMQMLEWSWSALAKQIPYLTVPPASRQAWQRRRATHDGRLHVGVEWRTETEQMTRDDPFYCRSMPCDALQPLIEMPEVVCHSLHVGVAGARELQSCFPSMSIADWSREIDDFLDTAAAVAALDAVVTVDTAITHVAGALGKPTLLLLPHRGDWRWGDATTPAEWYPSCRVLRQPSPGAWAPVMTQAVDALRAMHAAAARESSCLSWRP